MTDLPAAEGGEVFGRRPRVEDESLALKYATAAAIAVPKEVLVLDDLDALEGRNIDTPYWRTKRYGHAEVRDNGHMDELDLYERVHLQASVKRLLGNRQFVEFVRTNAKDEPVEGQVVDDRKEG